MKSEVLKRKDQEKDFPCGTVDENPTATAGATGSISALGRFNILQSNEACGPQLLGSLVLQLLKPAHPEPGPAMEKPLKMGASHHTR